MEGGRFEIALVAARRRPTSHGSEQVEFRVASHPKQPLGPLAQGRLGRRAVAHRARDPGGRRARSAQCRRSIFDEVDAGIGGAVAATVGRLLQALGDAPAGAVRDAPAAGRRVRRRAFPRRPSRRRRRRARGGRARSHGAARDRGARADAGRQRDHREDARAREGALSSSTGGRAERVARRRVARSGPGAGDTRSVWVEQRRLACRRGDIGSIAGSRRRRRGMQPGIEMVGQPQRQGDDRQRRVGPAAGAEHRAARDEQVVVAEHVAVGGDHALRRVGRSCASCPSGGSRRSDGCRRSDPPATAGPGSPATRSARTVPRPRRRSSASKVSTNTRALCLSASHSCQSRSARKFAQRVALARKAHAAVRVRRLLAAHDQIEAALAHAGAQPFERAADLAVKPGRARRGRRDRARARDDSGAMPCFRFW